MRPESCGRATWARKQKGLEAMDGWMDSGR